MDDNLWLIELESALLDDCSVNEIYSICRGRSIPESLRPDVWQICLNVRHRNDQMAHFNEIFDLPFQNQLREDCRLYGDKLGNDEGIDKLAVVSDMESILTFYCKNRNMQYTSNNGWIDLLMPLISLNLRKMDTYNLFEAIRDTYIPKGCVKQGNVFHVFRLLILYHDPELCSILDTKKITADLYAMSWFESLFASTCNLQVILAMWDLYFQQTDPFLIFFLSLIMLINGRDQIIQRKNETREVLIEFLTNMPCALESDDVVDFCSLAQCYSLKTPSSFKTEYLHALFRTSEEEMPKDLFVSQALCLPVSVRELVENTSIDGTRNRENPDGVRFFLVDCRPANQYNAGHLPTAFHLDGNLMLQEPVAFQTAIQGLLRAQRNAIETKSHAGGEHLCFMGSGQIEEDQITYMVVASFLQKGTHYVSLLTGGYQAIHTYFGDLMIDCLEYHNRSECICCLQSTDTQTNSNKLRNHKKQNDKGNSGDIFGKLSAAMKSKSAEVKGKLFDYIVNPNVANAGSSSPSTPVQEKHVLSNEKNSGKRYRNMAPVFSIDEDTVDDVPTMGTQDLDRGNGTALIEEVSIQSYLKQPDVQVYFKCEEVHMNGCMHDSYLLVTDTNLIVLRLTNRKDKGKVIVKRPLSSIVKITAKKRHRDLITFKYGIPDGGTMLITDMDRFLIPGGAKAIQHISQLILELLDMKES